MSELWSIASFGEWLRAVASASAVAAIVLGCVLLADLALARRDPALSAALQLLTIAAWPLLPAWIAAWRVRGLMEQASDEAALGNADSGERRAHGAALLQVASWRPASGRMALAMPSFGGGLAPRMRALRHRRRWPVAAQRALVGMLAGAVVLASGEREAIAGESSSVPPRAAEPASSLLAAPAGQVPSGMLDVRAQLVEGAKALPASATLATIALTRSSGRETNVTFLPVVEAERARTVLRPRGEPIELALVSGTTGRVTFEDDEPSERAKAAPVVLQLAVTVRDGRKGIEISTAGGDGSKAWADLLPGRMLLLPFGDSREDVRVALEVLAHGSGGSSGGSGQGSVGEDVPSDAAAEARSGIVQIEARILSLPWSEVPAIVPREAVAWAPIVGVASLLSGEDDRAFAASASLTEAEHPWVLDLRLADAERAGRIHILSRPMVLVRAGQEASIESWLGGGAERVVLRTTPALGDDGTVSVEASFLRTRDGELAHEGSGSGTLPLVMVTRRGDDAMLCILHGRVVEE